MRPWGTRHLVWETPEVRSSFCTELPKVMVEEAFSAN